MPLVRKQHLSFFNKVLRGIMFDKFIKLAAHFSCENFDESVKAPIIKWVDFVIGRDGIVNCNNSRIKINICAFNKIEIT